MTSSRGGSSSSRTPWWPAWTSEGGFLPAIAGRLGGFSRARPCAAGGPLRARLPLARTLPGSFGRVVLPGRRSRFPRSGRKLESHFAVRAADQKRGERPALPGNEPVQEIRSPGSEELLYFLALDRSLEDHPPRAEVAGAVRVDAVLADVGHGLLEHPAAAFGTGPERRQPREIRLLGAFALRRSAEVELRTEFRSEPHHRREGLSHPAAETGQGS